MSYLIVRRQQIELRRWPQAFHGLHILHVSDLHFRTWNRLLERLRHALLNMKYDLLLLTGDFGLQPKDWVRTSAMIRRLFHHVRPPLGAFAVLGNHDEQNTVPILHEVGVRVLRNEAVRIARGRDEINVAGVDQLEDQSADLAATLAACNPRCPILLLAHYPSTVHNLPAGLVDLQFSGHTHAGQWRLPLWGCVWAHDHLSTRQAWGLHRVNGTYMHVSAGIGGSGPFPFRLNCPPEITLFTLFSPFVTCRKSQD